MENTHSIMLVVCLLLRTHALYMRNRRILYLLGGIVSLGVVACVVRFLLFSLHSWWLTRIIGGHRMGGCSAKPEQRPGRRGAVYWMCFAGNTLPVSG